MDIVTKPTLCVARAVSPRWMLAGLIALSAAACGDNGSALPAELTLTAVQTVYQVKPGSTATVSFRLTTRTNVPVAGERVDFAAVGDPQTPQDDLGGATFFPSSTVTDGLGIAMVTVAGSIPTDFQLTARNARAPLATTLIEVANGDPGVIDVIPEANGSVLASTISVVNLLLVRDQPCAALSTVNPPISPFSPPQTVALGAPGTFTITETMAVAMVGQGLNSLNQLVATGCVDVPSSSVISGSTVRVYLPLEDLVPTPSGTYTASFQLALTRSDLATKMAAPWQNLGDCPLDPGQLWLDCALEALAAQPGDTLDCVPATTGLTGAAALIAARRGSASVAAPCRVATLAGGAQSLDAKVAALFPSSAQPPVSDVDTLGPTVAGLLDSVTIGSSLTLQPTGLPDAFQATHALRTATFTIAGLTTSVDIVALGIPSSTIRFVSATRSDDVLSIDTHALGLHLGTLAHAAFSSAVLVSRGWPGDSVGYLATLFGAATTAPGPTHKTGCDALDALVCAEIGQSVGCLQSACVTGQQTLAHLLDAGFALADGDGADLQLSATAHMLDNDNDGIADQLGTQSNAGLGLWAGQIRAHAGNTLVAGTWSATRSTP